MSTRKPAADPEAHRAIEALQRLTELFAERRRQLASDAGLTETQWQVLEEVAGEGFMPSLFARRRACSPAAVSRTLRQLLEHELVRVGVGSADGRQRVYRPTAKGRRLLDRLRQQRAEAIEEVWTRFRPAELRAFARFAGVLGDRLEDYIASR